MRSRLVPLAAIVMIAASVALAAFTMAGGQGSRGSWMMGGFNPGAMLGGKGTVSGKPISIDAAVRIAQQTAAGYSGRALTVDEVMEFQNNFYASIREKDSGIGAFEILINRYSGSVSPEFGPNMMWNTAYGMMAHGGMMGAATQANGAMTVSKDQAASLAQTWLNGHRAGTSARPPDPFHGYYTVDFEKGGQVAGMLSVNGRSGQVWFHTWHGNFIQSKDLGK